MSIILPSQLCDTTFRFVPLRLKGQTMGKTKQGQTIYSTGKEPSAAWINHELGFDSPELRQHMAQTNSYAVAGGHGGLMILDIDHEQAFDWLHELPETFVVESGGKGLPHLYYRIESDDEPGFSRKVPLSDEEVKKYAELVLKKGTKVLASLQLETLFDLRGRGGLAVGPNSQLDADAVYEVHRDVPITCIDRDRLVSFLQQRGTTLKEQKAKIIALAKEQSPKFRANMEKRENRNAASDAPWNHPLWQSIIEAVGVSGVYDFMGEPFSPSVRNRCLLGHGSKSGQTVMCTDNKHWHCFSCGEDGDAFDLFRHIKGADNADGTSRFYEISLEFAALAGGDYKDRWADILTACRKAYGEKKRAERLEKQAAEKDALLAMLEDLNRNHFVTRHGGSVRIAEVDTDIEGKPTVFYYTEPDFIARYRNRKVVKTVYNPSKRVEETKITDLPNEWLNWEGRREHKKGVIFMPRELTPEESVDFFNTWPKFQVKPEAGCWDKIRYHLFHIWCRDSEDDFHYMMSWFAHLFQHPEIKPGVALLVKGGKGSGKSIITESLLAPILGTTYCQLDKPGQVTGRFNAHQHGKLLIALEEAVWAGDKIAEGPMKTLITSPTGFIEAKGKDGVTVPSYVRVIYLSNENRAVPATSGERRYFALRTNDEKAGDQAYFAALIDEIEHGGREAFLHAALHYEGLDILGMKPPLTDALLEDIEAGMEPFEQWIYYMLDNEGAIYWREPSASFYFEHDCDHFSTWGSEVPTAWLLGEFQLWINSAKKNGAYVGYSGISDVKAFSKELNKFFQCRKKIDNVSHFVLPEIREARKIFEKHIGRSLEWSITDEDINDAKILFCNSDNKKIMRTFRSEYRLWERKYAVLSERRCVLSLDALAFPSFEQIRDRFHTLTEGDIEDFEAWFAACEQREEALKARAAELKKDQAAVAKWQRELEAADPNFVRHELIGLFEMNDTRPSKELVDKWQREFKEEEEEKEEDALLTSLSAISCSARHRGA